MDAEGNQRHVKDADAKLVEREKEGVHPGKVMAILAGAHAGLICQVLALEPRASFQILSVVCCSRRELHSLTHWDLTLDK